MTGTGPFLLIVSFGSEVWVQRYQSESDLLAAVREGQCGNVIIAKELQLSVAEAPR